MKLLVFYPYIPFPLDRGTFQRTFHLLRELAQDHDVDLLALAENGCGTEHGAVFRQFCRRVEFQQFQHPPWEKLLPKRLLNPLPAHVAHWTISGLAEKIESLLQQQSYAAVYVCDIILAQYFVGKHASATARNVPLVIDRSRVDLLYQLMEHAHLNFPWSTKVLRYEGYLKLWFYERTVARRALVEVVCGADDAAFVRRFISPKAAVEVLINGVDLDYFRPEGSSAARAARPTVLFCGAMDYNANIDALRWYFRDIHPRVVRRVPDVHVLIVGKNPTDEVKQFGSLANVSVTGGVPDVRPFYREAWLHIVPLRIGGGSRLKIGESLAMGTPVVSTSIGAQGLGLRNGDDIVLADTAEDFACQTAMLLLDAASRVRLEGAGLRAARSRLSWKSLGRDLSSILDCRVLGKGARYAPASDGDFSTISQ